MDNHAGTDTVHQEPWHALKSTDIEGVGVDLPPVRLRTWGLVLAARAIPYRFEQNGTDECLLVPDDQRAAAISELQCYEQKNRNWPPALPPSPASFENTLSTLSVLLLLAVFHNLIRSDLLLVHGVLPDWLQLGMVQAAKICAGGWWRLITALTLHADLQHLLGNLAIGGIFVFFLCRELGSGLAWSLMLGAGILGNLINACLQSPDHNSVGASTAVFGAVGILAAISMVRYRQHLSRRWPLPVAAALSLLALLGTEGRNTDLGAHLFGFGAGILLGALAEVIIARLGPPGRLLNLLLACFSGLVVVVAWWFALTAAAA